MADLDPSSFLPLPQAQFHVLVALTDGETPRVRHHAGRRGSSDGIVRMGPATLYGTLKRLVDQGLAEELARRPEPDDDQRRRYYRLTGLGQHVSAPPKPTASPASCGSPAPTSGQDWPDHDRAAPALPVPGPPLPEALPRSLRRRPRGALRRPRHRPRRPGGVDPHRPRSDRHRPPLPLEQHHDRTAQRHTLNIAIGLLALGGVAQRHYRGLPRAALLLLVAASCSPSPNAAPSPEPSASRFEPTSPAARNRRCPRPGLPSLVRQHPRQRPLGGRRAAADCHRSTRHGRGDRPPHRRAPHPEITRPPCHAGRVTTNRSASG